MNYQIYGEDCRHAIVASLLTEAGFLMQAPADLLILSPRESFLSHTNVLKDGAYVWGGPAAQTTLLQSAGYHKIKQSNTFRTKNSIYTAEGALALAISETSVALCESTVFLLGYGYLGKECARLFTVAGAELTVYTENPEELLQAARDGYRAVRLTELSALDGTLVLNTIPFPVLDTLMVSAETAPALLLELASTPCTTKEIKGLRVLPAGALPSRFSPDSAARLMFEEIMHQLKKE